MAPPNNGFPPPCRDIDADDDDDDIVEESTAIDLAEFLFWFFQIIYIHKVYSAAVLIAVSVTGNFTVDCIGSGSCVDLHTAPTITGGSTD